MNGVTVIVDASCIYFIEITFYNRVWNGNLGTNFGITYGKWSMKLVSDIIAKIVILEILNMNFLAILIMGLIWINGW